MYQENKIVIFDWGGIVESHKKGEYNCFSQKVDLINKLTKTQLDEDNIIEKWKECDYDKYSKGIGETNDDEDILKWFERLKNTFNFNCTFDEFKQYYEEYGDKIFYYKDVVEFAHSLKNKCKIGILSNLCKLDYSRIDKHYNLSKFDYVWLSYELDSKKPNSRIYEIVENQCNTNPKNILFIDDVLDNIETAQERGWQTCQATGKELDKIKDSVNKFLQ